MKANFIASSFGKHKISTHTIAALVTGLILYYRTNPDFHALIAQVQSRIPKWTVTLGLAAAWLYAWYRNGRKQPGNGSGSGLGAITGLGIQAAVTVLLIVVLIPFASGCRHNVSKNPQIIAADALLDAANSVKLVSDGLAAANDFAENIQGNEPEYYAALKPRLVKIARANDKAIAAIRAAQAGDSSANWRAALAGILSAAGKQDLADFGFKTPNSQAEAKIALNTLALAIRAISESFGGGQ